ncbi:hypothetical protein, partial [Streptomyces murinus]|uniref:hypothetical protein n=1 Tax=Streptomyces murinus TaxID=33900 RepID=UPI003CC5D29D
MPLTSTRISPDWPCQVKTPGSYDWERSAAKWLRELIPARYASYPALIRHPVLLARHARSGARCEPPGSPAPPGSARAGRAVRG